MYGLLWYDNIWLRDNYLEIWNLRVQRNIEKYNTNIEKISFFQSYPNKVLSNAYNLSKKSFLYIFTVGNLQNIFMEHDLYLIC